MTNWLVGSIPKSVSAIGGRDTFIENPEGAQRCRECKLIDTCPAAYRSEEYSYTYMTIKERSDVAFLGMIRAHTTSIKILSTTRW